ncbi:MAG: MFS transporter, partial [Fimbriimonadaceae bacterium]|nr:MFS transporter [Fimbriimonadaceae bacterium]
MIHGGSALSIPAFRRLFIGQAISQMGDGFYYLVILFVAKQLAGDADWQVGLVGFCTALPFLLLSPYAGRVADRMDRRPLMVWSDVGSAIVTGALGLLALLAPDLLSVWLLAGAGALLSSINAFFLPARTAAIPNLVPPERLLDANSLAVSTQMLVLLLAQALSVSILGPIQLAFADLFLPISAGINAATFLVSAWYIGGLPALRPDQGDHKDEGTWREVLRGISVVRQDPFLAPALICALISNLFISGWMVVYLATNEAWFGGEFWTISLVEMSFFLVLAISSLWIGRTDLRRIGLAYGLAHLAIGLLCIPMAWARDYWAYLALNAACGLAVAYIWLPVTTYIQAGFPDAVRGRVSSLWGMIQTGIQPFGYAIAGPLVTILGISGMYIFMGAGIALAGV